MPSFFTFLLMSFGALSLLSAPAYAREMGIVAIVNDDVISSYDLEERMKLVLTTAGQRLTQEQIPQARNQILQGMIEDALKQQEANRYSIMVSQNELDAAIGMLEQQQGKPAGSLREFIARTGLSYASFAEQIRSQVAWRKLLARRVQRDITVNDDEVTRAQQRLSRGKAIPEMRIASVLLPPQEGFNDTELMGIAADIRSQLAQGREASELLAAYDQRLKMEFAPVRWMPESRLAPDLLEALSQLKPGDITPPLATPLGVQITRLLERRTLRSIPEKNAEVAMKQIILKLNNTSQDLEIDSKMQIAREIARYPGSCTESGIAGLQQFDGLDIEVNYYRTTTASMSPEVRSMIEPLPVTGITQPFASDDGIHLLMLCERISVPAPLPDKDKVRAMLSEEKMMLEAEKYLRKLKREAFLDIRI